MQNHCNYAAASTNVMSWLLDMRVAGIAERMERSQMRAIHHLSETRLNNILKGVTTATYLSRAIINSVYTLKHRTNDIQKCDYFAAEHALWKTKKKPRGEQSEQRIFSTLSFH